MLIDTITYQYPAASGLLHGEGGNLLFLSKYSEIQKKNDAPCFFWGTVRHPYILARCLVGLSKVVQAAFYLNPNQLNILRDPIVTAGSGKLRFEAFSQCAGVYARVDVLPDGLDGEFLDNGTTNVDFNPAMIGTLSGIRTADDLLLAVGSRDVTLYANGGKVVEKKVPLPAKWIKGLASVQLYLSETEEGSTFGKVEALKLFQGIPRTQVNTDYYLIIRGGRPAFTPAKTSGAVCIGGLHRLRLLDSLLPYADKVKVSAHPAMQSTSWQLYFGDIRFSLTLSRDTWRGFSGEGVALESLVEDIPDGLLDAMDKYGYANQEFSPTFFTMKEQFDMDKIENLTGRLAAMGLLGFDLDDKHFFYRQLPYKPERIIGLNPRLKGAEKLLIEDKVKIVGQTAKRIEARVESSGVSYTVIIDNGHARCTCAWYNKHQGERGVCKHVLAVKKLISYGET